VTDIHSPVLQHILKCVGWSLPLFMTLLSLGIKLLLESLTYVYSTTVQQFYLIDHM